MYRDRFLEDIKKMFDILEYDFPKIDDFSVGKLLPYPSEGKNVIENNYRKPLTDIWEDEKDYVANLEIPGVDKNDIEININEGNVEIKVEKKKENKSEDKSRGIYRYERSYNGFYRCFKLPKNVDNENIQAKYNNGILELKIPKLEHKNELRKIEVK